MLLAAALPIAGCGGLVASQAISPLDFILPGLIYQPDLRQSPTNSIIVTVQPDHQLALAQ
jgi:hypothetical protein